MTGPERQRLTDLNWTHKALEYLTDRFGSRWLFAIRYFNEEKEELAYYIPGLQPYGSVVFFDTPRRWSPGLLSALFFERRGDIDF